MEGKTIKKTVLSGEMTELEIKALRSALYFYQIRSNEKLIGSGKLVVQ